MLAEAAEVDHAADPLVAAIWAKAVGGAPLALDEVAVGPRPIEWTR